jgi:hypothetical protein
MSSDSKAIFAPSDRVLRQFSAIWIIFFGLIALRRELHHHQHTAAVVLAVLAVTIGPLGLIWPRAIKPIFVGWMALAYPIGWFVSRVILGILFYGLFTPVAWIFRMRGRDALGLKRQPEAVTYWHAKPQPSNDSQYLRQF